MVATTLARRESFVPHLPEGLRLYAVGDIHGRSDLLRQLHAQIVADWTGLPEGWQKMVVYLGDYVDRGDDSKGVIDLLLNDPLPECQQIFLKGNHEAEMQDFLVNPSVGHLWIQCGGMATALSYQVQIPARIATEEQVRALRDALLEAMPQSHQAFLASLRFRFEVGDYFFTHAGVRPGLPLNRQRPPDLLWIRDPFLYHEGVYEKMIVHGHTIMETPVVTPNRIGIDTGAWYSGHLTCLVLEGATRRFLIT
ncbi:MAG: serine/threonine protein phosphatase [Magnetococcales bacterium]|nr:serine/threonine protein phosphatase [Magnetococcales bacterium]